MGFHRRTVLALAVGALLLAACDSNDGVGLASDAESSTTITALPPLPHCGPADPMDSSHLLRPGWEVGDRRTYRISKTREDSTQPAPKVPLHTDVEVSVLDGTPGSAFRIRWEAGIQMVDSTGFGFNDDEQKIFDDMVSGARLQLEYTTDADGAFDQVENVDEVRDQISRHFDKVAALLDDVDEATAALTQQMVTSDAYLQSAAVEDVLLLHAHYGAEIGPGEEAVYHHELPNPWGGAVVPATATLNLAAQPDDNGCAVLTMVVEPDPDEFNRILAESLSDVAGRELTPHDPPFQLTNTVTFTYDRVTGWVHLLEAEKTIAEDTRTRVDRTVIRMT